MRGPWTSERLVLLREMLWALEGATAVDNAAPLQILAFIPGGRLMESTLHARFAASRLNGEWFRPTPDLVDLIAELGGKVA